jgi:hypothetical protein
VGDKYKKFKKYKFDFAFEIITVPIFSTVLFSIFCFENLGLDPEPESGNKLSNCDVYNCKPKSHIKKGQN